MSCREAMAELSAAADGELTPGRAGTLEAHLAGCPACTAFRARLVALRRRLRFEPVGAVPDVAPRVLETIRSTGLRQGGVDNRRTAFAPWARLPLRGARDREPGLRRGRRGVRPGGTGVGAGRRGRVLPVAAAFLGGVVLGATFIGLGRGGPGQVAMADLPARVVAAQRTVRSLAADVSLVERGWHPSVPERRFTGRLRYRAP